MDMQKLCERNETSSRLWEPGGGPGPVKNDNIRVFEKLSRIIAAICSQYNYFRLLLKKYFL
jgi:hypothetical protein